MGTVTELFCGAVSVPAVKVTVGVAPRDEGVKKIADKNIEHKTKATVVSLTRKQVRFFTRSSLSRFAMPAVPFPLVSTGIAGEGAPINNAVARGVSFVQSYFEVWKQEITRNKGAGA